VKRDIKNGKTNPECVVTKRLLFVDRLLCNQERVEALAQEIYWYFKMLIRLHISLHRLLPYSCATNNVCGVIKKRQLFQLWCWCTFRL